MKYEIDFYERIVMTQVTEQAVYTKKQDEAILVVRRDILFSDAAPQGLIAVDLDLYFNRIQEHKEFLWRSMMETDEAYKQIIPVIVFMHQEKIFLMQRSKKSGDARLKEKYTVGIGGHVREEDLQGETSIDAWSKREFLEEVDYQGELTLEPLGLLNDDSDSVGRVHTGFVYLARGTTSLISIKSELQSGALVTLQEAFEKGDRLENWSALIIKHLMNNTL